MSPDPFSPERFEKFFAKVAESLPPPGSEHLGNCWLWTGHINGSGYGSFHCPGFPLIGGGSGSTKNALAHRWCTAFWFGVEVLRGLTYDHLCRRASCVNPRHGSAITRPENTARGNRLRHVEPEHGVLESWGF